MEKIALPNTDLKVSRVCLGTIQFAGSVEEGQTDVTWGAVTQDTVLQTVVAALDAGINFFDCAEAYGPNNQAERAFGEALRACGRRDEAVIASKFGKHKALWETSDPTGEQAVYDGDAVARALDASLAALQTDRIELYQVHWPGNIGIVGDEAACRCAGTWSTVCSAVAALEAARSAGKILHWGVCNFGVADLAALDAAGGSAAVSNQLPYNLLWRPLEASILPECARRGMGVLCYSALQQGLLSGRFMRPDDVPDGRRRTRLFRIGSSDMSRHSDASSAEYEELVFGVGGSGGGDDGDGDDGEGRGVLEAIRAICASQGVTMAQAAVAWLLAQPGVHNVLVGASSPEQVERNAALVQLGGETVAALTATTEVLRARMGEAGNIIDQYAAESRIH